MVTSIPKGTILERLIDFVFSIPDFRRTDKGNIRHQLGDVIILMNFARMSRCVGRADIIEFGKHNLKKLQSLGLIQHTKIYPTRFESGKGIMCLFVFLMKEPCVKVYRDACLKVCAGGDGGVKGVDGRLIVE